MCSAGLNFCSDFQVKQKDSRVQQETHEEGRRLHRPNRRANNTQDEKFEEYK